MSKLTPKSWKIADLIDLEFFLAQDADADEDSLIRRDRELYRKRLADSPPASRRQLLLAWLDLRREVARGEQTAPLPGEVVSALLRPLALLLFVVSAFAGAGLAWGVLSYAGDQPINLFGALGLLVALPFFLALLSFVVPLIRLVRGRELCGPFGGKMVAALLVRLSRGAYSFLGVQERNRQALAQGVGSLRGRGGLYAGVVGWLAFALMQLAALGFSLAVFFTVLLRGWIADLAFSWQTTTHLSAEAVHRFVATVARPWSTWTSPPFSHPTMEQVAGSRVFLKEGLQHLSSADLQSWWYFLLWAIAVYTILPRLLLLGGALWGGRRARGRLSFHDARCEGLIRRMRQPQLHIGKEGEPEEDRRGGQPLPPEGLGERPASLQALVPQEVAAESQLEQWRRDIEREFRAGVESIVSVKLDEIEDAELLRFLSEKGAGDSVLLVLEGWQPCITATLEYLKSLRRALGGERLLVVALVGRESREGARSPTPEQEFGIWRSRLAALGDPLLLVHNWGRLVHE